MYSVGDSLAGKADSELKETDNTFPAVDTIFRGIQFYVTKLCYCRFYVMLFKTVISMCVILCVCALTDVHPPP